MSETKPLYLLAGGNFGNPRSMLPLLKRALAECGDKPRVAYIGTASGDNVIFFCMMRSLLKEAGAAKTYLVKLAKNNIDLPAARRALERADAIFISGGEVDDGMRWLEFHWLAVFLRELYGRGKLFIGLSAGSIMMGAHWVRWEDPKDDQTAELFDCLGFVPATLDTHAEDEDWKELKTALRLQSSGAIGYGIPKGSMAVADSAGILSSEIPLIRFVNNGGAVQRE
ncbi:MAG: Type 1 glutamine amidotransferase-like domain-containing protein [Burkholderiales bacterium]